MANVKHRGDPNLSPEMREHEEGRNRKIPESASQRQASQIIKDGIWEWLWKNAGQGHVWKTQQDMDVDAANDADASMITSHRWLIQFCAPGRPFMIEKAKKGYRLELRANGGNGGEAHP